MRTLVLLPALAAALLGAQSALAATKTVAVTATGFQPATVSVEAGDVISFQNMDTRTRRPVSANVPFTAPILRPGESWSTPELVKEGRFSASDALVANQRLAITVTKPAPPTTPTLTASRLQVVFGGPVVLRGKVPSERAGQAVTLRAEVLTPAGTRQATSVTQATTTAGGVFRFPHAPSVFTTYTVVWQGATSAGISVSVAPRVTLSVVRTFSSRRVVFSTSARSALSYAGKSVYLQRRTSAGRWVSIKRVVLGPSAAGTRVTVRLPRGLSRIRVLLPKSQVGTGYVAGVSRTLQVVR